MTNTLIQTSRVLHMASLFLVGAIGLAAVTYTILSALGVMPWLTLSATFGETVITDAGMFLQIALTVIAASFIFFLPTNARIVSLENSHRDFNIKMEDVARAYHYAHSADRAGVFRIGSEFDEVRERIAYLRSHPDLQQLENDVLEVAAQMGQQSKHIAEIYSDENVARAKEILAQRQQEAARQEELITEAMNDCTEINRWAEQVEVEEAMVASRLGQLEERLRHVLPRLGYEIASGDTGEAANETEEKSGGNIVPIRRGGSNSDRIAAE